MLNFERKYPMLKTFQVGKENYIYDAKSSLLANVDISEIKMIYNEFSSQNKNQKIPDYLKQMQQKGVFISGPLKKITPEENEIVDIINSQLEQFIPRTLMLEITENWNLNCSYCLFSKGNSYKKRKHSLKNMTEQTAYKAIDYYYYEKYTHTFQTISSMEKN